jgi:hypothetical protein
MEENIKDLRHSGRLDYYGKEKVLVMSDDDSAEFK